MESTLAHESPSRTAIVPAGLAASQCKAMQKSGLGKSLNNPSSSIAFAPAPISSAGWEIKTKVPDQLFFIEVKIRAVPTQFVMCKSCPHACITPVSNPLSFRATALLA